VHDAVVGLRIIEAQELGRFLFDDINFVKGNGIILRGPIFILLLFFIPSQLLDSSRSVGSLLRVYTAYRSTWSHQLRTGIN
jgi:hypothetical protein